MSADILHQGPVSPGRLRIYLGYAPGAGTTCALLGEGHQRHTPPASNCRNS